MTEQAAPLPAVSAILVSWNTRELLAEAIASVPQRVSVGTVEILVVDNASTDDSPALVRERFPAVQLMCNSSNVGFARANNQAFARAKGEFWLLLNSDARLLPGALEALLDPLQADPACAAVGARLVFPDGRFQASYNDFPALRHELLTLTGLARSVYGPWFPSHPDGEHQDGGAVDWVSGACMLLRAEAIRAVGGFDDDFPFYSEEMDLCKRLAEAGWTVQYAPKAEAVHHGGGSTGPRSAEQARLLWSSRIRYHRKHASPLTARLLPPLVRGAYLVRALWWGLRASSSEGDRASAWQARANGAWTVVREIYMTAAMSTPPTAVSAPSLPTCTACNTYGSRLLYRQAAFCVYHCGQCGARFVVPNAGAAEVLEAQLADEATAQGDQYMTEVFEQNEAFWLAHWSERVRSIEAFLRRKGRLLDIGGAMGHFQAAAQRAGWQTVGVEMSEEQVGYAREHFGLDARPGRFEDARLTPRSFDAVTLWSVIEHVPEPLDFLAKTRELMTDDSVLALQTPNAASLITVLADLGYRLSGGRFLLGVYSLDHVFRFDAASLRGLLERSGYRDVVVEPYDNLDVMVLRMSLQPRPRLRRATLRLIHTLAAWTGRPNQLVAYGRRSLATTGTEAG